jgi:hypothetical protein
MKYFIKRELASDPEMFRYFAEDENGRFIEGTVYCCRKDAPSTDDFASDLVISKLKAVIKLQPKTIKTIEL